VGPTESARTRGTGRQSRQGRPARRPADDSTGHNARSGSGLGKGVMASEQYARAWEVAYRRYGQAWELTARSPKGDPDAAQEMAAASRAVAAAWRQIAAATTLPWWAMAATESAAGAFESQAFEYETPETNEEP
jgi:hypothetical protein